MCYTYISAPKIDFFISRGFFICPQLLIKIKYMRVIFKKRKKYDYFFVHLYSVTATSLLIGAHFIFASQIVKAAQLIS